MFYVTTRFALTIMLSKLFCIKLFNNNPTSLQEIHSYLICYFKEWHDHLGI